MRVLLYSLLLFCLSLPAMAQDTKTVLDVPPGQTLVNLSANEQVEVRQDLLVANLRVELQDDDPKALQDRINETMKKAVAQAKKYPDVKVSTQQYYVYPYDYDPNPRPLDRNAPAQKPERTWRGSQALELKSRQADALLTLVGELQEAGLTMSGLNYTISPELQEETQESLMEAALAKLQAKAARAAKALGKTDANLLQVDINTGGGYAPQPMMRTMAMGAASAEMAAPVAEPGQSTITLTVSATAILK